MVCTTNDEPPPTNNFHCVPRKWCKPVHSPPSLVWDDVGTGGRRGALWQTGSFGLLQVTNGRPPPTNEHYELISHRFLLGGDSNVWLPSTLRDAAL